MGHVRAGEQGVRGLNPDLAHDHPSGKGRSPREARRQPTTHALLCSHRLGGPMGDGWRHGEAGQNRHSHLAACGFWYTSASRAWVLLILLMRNFGFTEVRWSTSITRSSISAMMTSYLGGSFAEPLGATA